MNITQESRTWYKVDVDMSAPFKERHASARKQLKTFITKVNLLYVVVHWSNKYQAHEDGHEGGSFGLEGTDEHILANFDLNYKDIEEKIPVEMSFSSDVVSHSEALGDNQPAASRFERPEKV